MNSFIEEFYYGNIDPQARSFEQIRQMIKESDGDTFEENRSLDQDLTFEAT